VVEHRSYAPLPSLFSAETAYSYAAKKVFQAGDKVSMQAHELSRKPHIHIHTYTHTTTTTTTTTTNKVEESTQQNRLKTQYTHSLCTLHTYLRGDLG
jgi:hypothetical protein